MALPFGVRQKPSLVEMPAQRVAVVRSVGDPNVVGAVAAAHRVLARRLERGRELTPERLGIGDRLAFGT